MNTTLVRGGSQPTLYELIDRLWTAVAALLVALLRSYGLIEPERHTGRHWLREPFGADEQTADEFHAVGVQLGEDREFGRPHGLLVDDTQVFDALDFADAAPRVAAAYAAIGGAS